MFIIVTHVFDKQGISATERIYLFQNHIVSIKNYKSNLGGNSKINMVDGGYYHVIETPIEVLEKLGFITLESNDSK